MNRNNRVRRLSGLCWALLLTLCSCMMPALAGDAYYVEWPDGSVSSYASREEAEAAASEQKELYSGSTDENGEISLPWLRSGEIVIVEEVPEGYSAGSDTTEADLSAGSVTIVNTRDTPLCSLTFRKAVEGNMASRDKFFAVTLTLSGLPEGSVCAVDLTGAVVHPAATASTSKALPASQPDHMTAGEDGSAAETFYLQHGQSITVSGLPAGTAYSLKEDAEDYLPSLQAEGDEDCLVSGAGDALSDSSLETDTVVTFTNTRDGSVPTGAVLPVLPYAAAAVTGAPGLVVLWLLRKKRQTQ